MYTELASYYAAFAANGTTAGVIQLSAVTGLYPGMVGHIIDDNLLAGRVLITEIVDSTHIRVKLLAEEGVVPTLNYYKSSDISAWTTANHAKINVPKQLVNDDIIQRSITKLW